jgi:putative acetyltransferase
MLIRPETPADHAGITAVEIEAFAVHPYSQQTEHLIVDALRSAHALSISLVAELDGRIVGHIAFSPATINGAACNWYLLGPIGVALKHQRCGIGSRLVEAGLSELLRRGAAGCVLVGDPAYYTRFGFRSDPALTFEGVPPENFMVLHLTTHHPTGRVDHHPAFLVTA